MDFGLPELIIILVLVLLLFGGSRLPKLSRSIGEAMRELRNGLTGSEPAPKSPKTAAQNKNQTKA